jgi:hypothetical protein
VAAVVAAADGHALGVEEDHHGVEGGEPRGVGHGGPAEEGGQDGLVAGGGGRFVARVDVEVI